MPSTTRAAETLSETRWRRGAVFRQRLSEPRAVGLLLCFGAQNKGLNIMKYLLLIALFFAVLWLLRKARPSRAAGQSPPAARAPEQMVKCAHCGVNQPVSESILTHGRYYCCEDHMNQVESRDS
jgi:uncharacterized protein